MQDTETIMIRGTGVSDTIPGTPLTGGIMIPGITTHGDMTLGIMTTGTGATTTGTTTIITAAGTEVSDIGADQDISTQAAVETYISGTEVRQVFPVRVQTTEVRLLPALHQDGEFRRITGSESEAVLPFPADHLPSVQGVPAQEIRLQAVAGHFHLLPAGA